MKLSVEVRVQAQSEIASPRLLAGDGGESSSPPRVLRSSRSAVLVASLWLVGCSSTGGPADSGLVARAAQDGQDSQDRSAGPNLPCERATCALQGTACGVIADGCGAFLDCGNCVLPEVCGALEPGKCGCKPITCAGHGAECGALDDGCGRTLECGACAEPDTCGGAGVPGVCGRPLCKDGWCFESPLPQSDTLAGAFIAADSDLWAAGAAGRVLRQTGRSIARVPSHTRVPSNLHALWIFPNGSGWAVGSHGALLGLDGGVFSACKSGGAHCTYWSQVGAQNLVRYDLNGIWAAGPDDVWVVGAGGVLRFDGSDWRELPQTVALEAVAGRAGRVWAAGARTEGPAEIPALLWTEKEVFTQVDLGGVGVGRLHALVIAQDGAVWAAGEAASGGLLVRVEGGTVAFRKLADTGPLRAAGQDQDGRLFFGGDAGVLLSTAGRLDELERLPALAGPHAILALTSGRLLAVGAHGLWAEREAGLWRSRRTWLPFGPARSEAVVYEHGPACTVAAADGFSAHWNGSTWGLGPVPMDVVGLFGVSCDRVFAAGNAGADALVLAWDGTAWSELHRRVGVRAVGLTASSPTDLRVALAGGKTLRCDERTCEVVRAALPPPPPPRAQSIRLTAAEGFVPVDGPATRIWPIEALEGPVFDAWGMEGQVWAVGDDGALHFDGTTFQKRSRASFRAVAGNAVDNVYFAGTERGRAALARWDGVSLTAVTAPAGGPLRDVSVTPDGVVVVAGDEVYRRKPTGDWEPLTQGGGPYPLVHAYAADDLWSARRTAVLHYQGGVWTATETQALLDQPPVGGAKRVMLERVHAVSATQMIFTGRSLDGKAAILLVKDGDTWGNGHLTSSSLASFASIWGENLNESYAAAGEVGSIYQCFRAAKLFRKVVAPQAAPVGALWGTGWGEMWAFGPHGVILHTVN